jgi:hypothetical protein
MTPRDYEIALLCLRSYQAAMSDNVDEILSIACVFRNRVMVYGKNYTQILEQAPVNRGYPDIKNPILINPQNGILAACEGIYKNETPDLTSNHNFKNGALWFGRPQVHQNTNDWFETNILKKQDEHPLIGQWGVQCFYV